MAEYMPRINGQLVYDQHAWSPAYATGYVSKEIDLQGGDPFEKSRAMQKIRRGWMDDDAHRFLTVHQKQYLPLHKREPNDKPKGRQQLIASRWQTPRVAGVKVVTKQTETARILALDTARVAARRARAAAGGTGANDENRRPPRAVLQSSSARPAWDATTRSDTNTSRSSARSYDPSHSDSVPSSARPWGITTTDYHTGADGDRAARGGSSARPSSAGSARIFSARTPY